MPQPQYEIGISLHTLDIGNGWTLTWLTADGGLPSGIKLGISATRERADGEIATAFKEDVEPVLPGLVTQAMHREGWEPFLN